MFYYILKSESTSVWQTSFINYQNLKSKTYYNITFETSQLPPGMKDGRNIICDNIYNSGKVMFQGKMRKLSHNSCFQDILLLLPTNNNVSQSSAQTLAYNHFNCIGSDEAGSGDYFGPLTVCAAYVSKEHIQILKTLVWMIPKIK